MSDINDVRVFGAGFNEFGRSLTKAMNAVPKPTMLQLRKILSAYYSRGAFDMVFDRMNNRSVAQIIAEFDGDASPSVASGEIEGVKYRLYNAPEAEDFSNSGDRTTE